MTLARRKQKSFAPCRTLRANAPHAVLTGVLWPALFAATALVLSGESTLADDLEAASVPDVVQVERAVRAQINDGKYGALAKIGTSLATLYRASQQPADRVHSTDNKRNNADLLRIATPFIQRDNDDVIINAVAADDTKTLLRVLRTVGMTDISVNGRQISGRVPIAALGKLAASKSLKFASPARVLTLAGSVHSEGSKALRANRLRYILNVRGRGTTIGVLSDSFNCLGGAAEDIASGDLPGLPRLRVLDEGPCRDAIDEGRAMMQLIRDVAPMAKQVFHSAVQGKADFANAILELADKTQGGADIIVDDVIYFDEPMFQDGIVAQAIDQVRSQGVAYFSAAGNAWRNAWDSGEQGFQKSYKHGVSGMQHDFDSGPAVASRQTVQLAPGPTTFVLQWDQPYYSVSGPPGASTDLDLMFYTSSGTPLGGGSDNNINKDPVETITIVNPASDPVTIEVAIEKVKGRSPGFMKYVIFGPGGDSYPLDYATLSGSLYGHANARGALAVGAARYDLTPPFGITPPLIESYSSAGGTPILFDKLGRRIPDDYRKKPEIVAADGTITTFFGKDNRFYGTSAAAPHAAAVAALLREIDPDITTFYIYHYLKMTAIDMDDPGTLGFDEGFDFGSGYGLIDAFRAGKRTERKK